MDRSIGDDMDEALGLDEGLEVDDNQEFETLREEHDEDYKPDR